MTLPALTAQQRSDALARAADARLRRARAKDAIKHGRMSLSEFLEQAKQDEALGRMRVLNLLLALPRVGTRTAEALMDEIGISPTRRVRGLGSRQRAELIARFG
ncbi:MAG: integration host factor, actinobacterial type [Actinomyces sp.]|uniref:integration host factor, actinobacterial type n=1 Tax=Actinomyces sp. TaxID=29317 RepID=UPI0026DB53ED|nr:integration host factor, actinobacterial type [Actinomyces sp.]MDO4244154.1 integration host factor, actinobacterial type [Actinomyces sp.]